MKKAINGEPFSGLLYESWLVVSWQILKSSTGKIAVVSSLSASSA